MTLVWSYDGFVYSRRQKITGFPFSAVTLRLTPSLQLPKLSFFLFFSSTFLTVSFSRMSYLQLIIVEKTNECAPAVKYNATRLLILPLSLQPASKHHPPYHPLPIPSFSRQATLHNYLLLLNYPSSELSHRFLDPHTCVLRGDVYKKNKMRRTSNFRPYSQQQYSVKFLHFFNCFALFSSLIFRHQRFSTFFSFFFFQKIDYSRSVFINLFAITCHSTPVGSEIMEKQASTKNNP